MSNFKSFQFCLALLLVTICQFFVTPKAQAQAQTDSAKQELFQRRRDVVMEFVHENHPEMEALLLALEESRPAKFRSAITRIGKTSLRIRSFKDKQPQRYVALLELWKVKSEIEILTARLAKHSDDQLRSQLDALVELFVDNRRRVLEIEKHNIEQRLERTNRLLETIETDRDAFVKKNLRSIDRTIKQLKSGKPAKK